MILLVSHRSGIAKIWRENERKISQMMWKNWRKTKKNQRINSIQYCFLCRPQIPLRQRMLGSNPGLLQNGSNFASFCAPYSHLVPSSFKRKFLGVKVMYTHQCNVVENSKFPAWTRHSLPTRMSCAYVVVPYRQLYLILNLSPFLLHLTAFGANIYLVDPLGGVKGAWASFTVYSSLFPTLSLWPHDINCSSFYPYWKRTEDKTKNWSCKKCKGNNFFSSTQRKQFFFPVSREHKYLNINNKQA